MNEVKPLKPMPTKRDRIPTPFEVQRKLKEDRVKEMLLQNDRMEHVKQVSANKDFMWVLETMIDTAEILKESYLKEQKFQESFGQMLVVDALSTLYEIVMKKEEEQQPQTEVANPNGTMKR